MKSFEGHWEAFSAAALKNQNEDEKLLVREIFYAGAVAFYMAMIDPDVDTIELGREIAEYAVERKFATVVE